jgi:hypothetical protein
MESFTKTPKNLHPAHLT